jgi:hypothetical protein
VKKTGVTLPMDILAKQCYNDNVLMSLICNKMIKLILNTYNNINNNDYIIKGLENYFKFFICLIYKYISYIDNGTTMSDTTLTNDIYMKLLYKLIINCYKCNIYENLNSQIVKHQQYICNLWCKLSGIVVTQLAIKIKFSDAFINALTQNMSRFIHNMFVNCRNKEDLNTSYIYEILSCINILSQNQEV